MAPKLSSDVTEKLLFVTSVGLMIAACERCSGEVQFEVCVAVL